MKILFVFNGDFIEGNASNARLKAYGKYLQQEGVNTKFLVLRPSEFADDIQNANSKGVIDGLDYQYLSGEVSRQKGAKRFFELFTIWFAFLILLRKQNRKETILYFYGAQFLTHFPILLLTKLFGFKCIIELTELHSLKKESNAIKTTIARLNNQFIEWTLPFWFNHVFLTSRRLFRLYNTRFKNLSTSIIPVVVDFERFENQELKRTNTLGYLGSFAPKDGVEGIVSSFAKVFDAMQGHIKLKLIGYQPKAFNLDGLLQKHGFEKENVSVEATGKVDFDEIPSHLSDCDLLVMNRPSEPFSNYGFPIKLAEYMATGRPCICTDVSDISFYFKDGIHCKIIEPENSSMLEQMILARYGHYDEYNMMGQNGKNKAFELFSADFWAKEIKRVVTNL